MIIIKRIEIEGFRSVRQAAIDITADLTCFAGMNNSGKSNVLKALNAFSNDETDPGKKIDIDTDYYRPDRTKKRKKQVIITVEFQIPSNFKFRKGLEGAQKLLGSKSFRISKAWSRDPGQPKISLDDRNLDDYVDRQYVQQFLQLIKYRYVPNRVLPIELIKSEHQSLRDVLIRRLAKKDSTNSDAFKEISDTSARMIESLTKRFRDACPGQGDVRLATPASWHELAFAFGYKLTSNGVEIEDSAQGSGIQSLLMLETLYLIDRDYFQQFGWKQAAIWGLEEPESSLHTVLEARVAMYLREIASDVKSRLQVLCTTHSDLMVQYSGCAIVVKQEGAASKYQSNTDIRAALAQLTEAGVSRWVHPLLHYPLDPVVIVEGKTDREFFSRYCVLNNIGKNVRFVDIGILDDASTGGGVERTRKYIKEHASAIKSRGSGAPVVVVLDHDSSGKLESFQKLVPDCSAYKVTAWPDDAINPNIGTKFRGLERCLADRVFEEGVRRGASIVRSEKGKHAGRFVIDKDDFAEAKNVLSEIICEGLMLEDYRHSNDYIKNVLRLAGVDVPSAG